MQVVCNGLLIYFLSTYLSFLEWAIDFVLSALFFLFFFFVSSKSIMKWDYEKELKHFQNCSGNRAPGLEILNFVMELH